MSEHTLRRLADLERRAEHDRVRSSTAALVYNAQTFGAAPTATMPVNTAALMAAIAAAATTGGIVGIGPGTYALSPFTVPSGVVLRGAGSGSTTLDFSGMTGTTSDTAIEATGTTTALPALAANIAQDVLTLTFTTPPAAVVGDVLRIYDKENYSFSRARSYYRAGEFCQVKSVSGNVVTLTQPTYAAYSATALTTTASLGGVAGVPRVTVVKVNPVRVGFSGMSMRFKVGSRGLRVTDGLNPFFDDLDLTGSDLSNLEVKRCYGVMINSVRIWDGNPVIQYGKGVLNYGLIIASCQHVTVNGCLLEAGRHGMTVGGAGADGDVSSRDLTFSGGMIGNNLANYTYTTLADTTIASNVLTNVASFSGFRAGDPVSGAGIPVDTTISSIDDAALTMTLDQNATATASGVTISRTDSAGGVMGCNLHGNCEFVRFAGVSMPRGYNPSGNHSAAIGCAIGSGGSGLAIYGSGNELTGWDHIIQGCTIDATTHVLRNFAAVHVSAGSIISDPQQPGGTFRFIDNVVNVGPYASMNRDDPDPALWTLLTGLNMIQIVNSAGYKNQKQIVRLTGVPTGGTFTLTYSGQTTAGIAYNATAAAVQAALEALPNIANRDVTVVSDAAVGHPWTVYFGGALVSATTTPAELTASGVGLTGGTAPSVLISASVADQNCEITGNTITSNRATFGGVYALVVQAATNKAWKRVNISGNRLRGGGVWARGTNAEQLAIEDNDVDRALAQGLRVDVNATDTAMPKRVQVRRNTIHRAAGTGMLLNGAAATDTLDCTDNTSIDNALNPAASSNLDNSAYLSGWLEATFQRNRVGDHKPTTTQSRSVAFNTITLLRNDGNINTSAVTTINRTAITKEIARTTTDGLRVVAYGTAAPTVGTWAVGDELINTAPTTSKAIDRWRCITAGTPGTWRAVGTGSGTTAQRPVLVANDAGYQYDNTTTGTLQYWSGAAWLR